MTQLVLRPYQQDCINTCLRYLQQGIRRQVVSLPVGSGKTVIFSQLLQRLPTPHPTQYKTLVCAHRQELLHQAARQIKSAAPHLKVEIDQGKNNASIFNSDVVVASVPTLGRKFSERLARYDPSEFKCIVIDEAHHAAAESYLRILRHFNCIDKSDETSPFVWGCSATVERHDRLALEHVFDQVTYHKGFLEMIQEGWLCKLRLTTIKTPLHVSKLPNRQDDYAVKALSAVVNVAERNELIVRSFMNHAKDRKSTIVFAVDVQHVHDLVRVFQAHGVDARSLTGTTDAVDRLNLLQGFRAQEFPVLVNCGILTEGTDIPVTDCIVLARPTKSKALLQQMVGRGMRKWEGKEYCLVLDFVDHYTHGMFQSSIGLHNGPCTVPTLFGLDAEMQVDGDVEEVVVREKVSESVSMPSLAPASEELVQHMMRASIVNEYHDLENMTLGEDQDLPLIKQLSRNNWIQVGEATWLLSLPNGSLLCQQMDGGGYKVQRRIQVNKKKNPYALSSHQDMFDNLTPFKTVRDALNMADQWVRRTYGYRPQMTEWSAAWRKEPATTQQLGLLKSRGLWKEGDWTKGRAADMLTRSFEGVFRGWRQAVRNKKRTESKGEVMNKRVGAVMAEEKVIIV